MSLYGRMLCTSFRPAKRHHGLIRSPTWAKSQRRKREAARQFFESCFFALRRMSTQARSGRGRGAGRRASSGARKIEPILAHSIFCTSGFAVGLREDGTVRFWRENRSMRSSSSPWDCALPSVIRHPQGSSARRAALG
jgi:hypothetical protein